MQWNHSALKLEDGRRGFNDATMPRNMAPPKWERLKLANDRQFAFLWKRLVLDRILGKKSMGQGRWWEMCTRPNNVLSFLSFCQNRCFIHSTSKRIHYTPVHHHSDGTWTNCRCVVYQILLFFHCYLIFNSWFSCCYCVFLSAFASINAAISGDNIRKRL